MPMTNFSGTKTTALILCNTACNKYWASNGHAVRLGLQGTALKLTMKGINKEELTDRKSVQLTITPHKNQDNEAFTVLLFVKETLNVGSNMIDVNSMQETYSHLAVIDLIKFSNADTDKILRQDVYHAIRPLEDLSVNENGSPFAVHFSTLTDNYAGTVSEDLGTGYLRIGIKRDS